MAEMMNNNNEEKFARMTLNERFQHFFLLISFITLVITGFALKFPDALWVSWIRNLFGDKTFDWRGDLHRGAAVVMVAISIYHIFYISISNRGKQLVKDLWFKKQDLTDLMNALKYYTGKSKERPKYGRFSYIEKAEYWAVAWGTVVMGGTGGVLWFENTFLPVISNSGMDLATAIHFYEAILASLAIFVWHFYFVIYNPDVYPMNKAWYRGYLTREEMELEHPLELEEIEKENKTVFETEEHQALTDAKIGKKEINVKTPDNEKTDNEKTDNEKTDNEKKIDQISPEQKNIEVKNITELKQEYKASEITGKRRSKIRIDRRKYQ
jgi:formate dehydrogenase gamma subunit